MKISCARCGKKREALTGEVNRAKKRRAPMYCGLQCFALSRRIPKAVKVLRKRRYDKRRRADPVYAAKKKAQNRAWFKRTYDPVKAAKERKKNAARHLAYISQPKWRTWKRDYDKRRRETNLKARYGLPAYAPNTLAESIHLLKALRKERNEYERA